MDNEKIALDFDGVINENPGGDPKTLMPGAKEALVRLSNSGYEVYILTARKDLEGVARWIYQQTGLHLRVTNTKERAVVYVDDRGLRFTNWPDTMNTLKNIL